MKDVFDFSALPTDTLLDRFTIMAVGIGFTLVTQSSSAGVAATLTALFSGLIHFEQAAALVVGMDIGTTVTAALATTGAATSAKRTGFSHVIYNLVTGLTALMIITPYIWVWEALSGSAIEGHAEVALITFHSTFNLLGVFMVLPFTRQFAHMMHRMVPDAGEGKEYMLEEALLEETDLAMDAACEALRGHYVQLAQLTLGKLNDVEGMSEQEMTALGGQLDTTQAFVDRIPLVGDDTPRRQRLVDMMHALDHLQRLLERCEEEPHCQLFVGPDGQLGESARALASATVQAIDDMRQGHWQSRPAALHDTRKHIHEQHKPYRAYLMVKTADDHLEIPDATLRLDAFRWLDRVSTHLLRAFRYITAASLPNESAR